MEYAVIYDTAFMKINRVDVVLTTTISKSGLDDH